MIGLETYYLSGLPIPLKNQLGKIYPLTIRYMLENGIDYNDFLKPFLIRSDMVENINRKICDLDLFFDMKDETLLDLLVCNLKILYKTDNVEKFPSIKTITINNSIMITKHNYTYLADVVLEMMCATRVKPEEKKQKYKNAQLQATWEKLQRYREKEEKKKALQLVDIMNMLIHVNNDLNYDKVLNLTYYQAINSYMTLKSKEAYNEFMMYKTSGQFKMEQDAKHWTIETKIKKSAYSENE